MRSLLTGLAGFALALCLSLGIGNAIAHDPPPGGAPMGGTCPMCGMEMGPHGMGMGPGGMMMAPLMDPKTTMKVTNNADGVTVSLSNPDKTTAQQLQRMAQIFMLRHEMMRTQMSQMHPAPRAK